MNEEELKAKAEADAKIAAAEAAIKENEALKADAAKKDAELKALREKDTNFNKLHQKTATEIQAAEDAKKAKEVELEGVNKRLVEMEAGVKAAAEERQGRLVAAYAGNDEELKKTILYHFERVKGAAKTDAEIEAAMKDAYILSTGGNANQDVIRGVQAAGGGGNRIVAKGPVEVSPELAAAADTFAKHGANIKPEDLKNEKYKVKPGQSAESTYKL